jgi:acyl carrier protein
MIPLTQLASNVLGMPAAEVTDEVGPATHAEWSSIKHLQLIVAVEENYGLSLSRAEIRSIRTLGDLREQLLTKGATP